MSRHRVISAILVLLLCGFVLYLYSGRITEQADLLRLSYLQHFREDTLADNAVTAIYLNYRMFDSIFETLMLLVSVLAVVNLSWRNNND